ncbi:MAG: hypothetical protein KAT28_00085 [Candidatus Aenigmarchaeota archaeon]|nr:hypothetical protein [Candidatus Aenigmarchaeota archaeon]
MKKSQKNWKVFVHKKSNRFLDVAVGILTISLILIIVLSIQQTELKISVDGNFKAVSDVQLPIDATEAEKIVKEFCEPKNPDYMYDSRAIKKVNNEWRVQIVNMNGKCYAAVDVKSGETNCTKCDDVKLFPPFGEVTITTDKTEYEQGETVEITIMNSLDFPIIPQAILPDKTKYIKFLGENYGIGFIERFEEGTWIGVEPIWRCGNSCFVECNYKHLFEPGEKRVFEWNQTILICDKVNRTEKVKVVGAGKYRIGSAVWLGQDAEIYKTIYSNEFTIKEKLALDPRCSEKVVGIGDCKILRIGYEFDSAAGKCIKEGINGCSFETPFETLEECQEVCEKKDMSCEQSIDCIEKCPRCVNKPLLHTSCIPRFRCVDGTCSCECICLS